MSSNTTKPNRRVVIGSTKIGAYLGVTARTANLYFTERLDDGSQHPIGKCMFRDKASGKLVLDIARFEKYLEREAKASR